MRENDTESDAGASRDGLTTPKRTPQASKEEPARRSANARQVLRFLYILHHAMTLPEGETLTKGRLAKICGCSDRTIQRDIRILEAEFGITRDDARGSFVLPEGALPALDLRLDVADVLALGLTEGILRNAGFPQQREVLAALAKVTHGLSPNLRRLLCECADALTPAALPLDYADAPLFPLLAAVRLRRTVSLDYDSASGGTRAWRRVDPYGVEAREGIAWELHGWCHRNRAFRTFALDAVHAVRTENDPYTFRAKAWEAFRAQNAVGGLRDDTPPVAIEVYFAPPVARYALRRRWPAPLVVTAEGDGALLRGQIPGGKALGAMVAQILRWRRFATVRGGPEFLAAFREEVAALHALYSENPEKK
jgi:predicted DNA-binding transcriptional regulator YafY